MSQNASVMEAQPAKMSSEEWDARVNLAAAHRFAELRGWQDAHMVYNHFTMRVPNEPGSFLIKSHDMLFGEVCASNLRKVEIDGPKLGFRENINPAGFAIHGGVLEARPEINVVLHLHSIPGTAMGALKRGLICLTQESMQFYNRVGYHDFEGVAEIEEREAIVRDLAGHKALILRNHGLLTCGRTVGEAVRKLFHLIRAAEIQLAVMATGDEIVQPPAEVCENTAKMFESLPVGDRDPDWQALRRWLDTRVTGYDE